MKAADAKERNWGGARAGSGRPRRESPRVAINLRLEPEVAKKFKRICQDSGRSQPKQFEHWVNLC